MHARLVYKGLTTAQVADMKALVDAYYGWNNAASAPNAGLIAAGGFQASAGLNRINAYCLAEYPEAPPDPIQVVFKRPEAVQFALIVDAFAGWNVFDEKPPNPVGHFPQSNLAARPYAGSLSPYGLLMTVQIGLADDAVSRVSSRGIT